MGAAFVAARATVRCRLTSQCGGGQFSRVVAAELYGTHRPFGYLYGGSGGAYQTMGGAEHTSGVWDGFMPFVMGSNNAVPSSVACALHALRILRKRSMFPVVMDAINPGGRGDMYGGLDEEERAALQEATLMGFPPRAWYNHETLHNGYFSDVFGVHTAAGSHLRRRLLDKARLSREQSEIVHRGRPVPV